MRNRNYSASFNKLGGRDQKKTTTKKKKAVEDKKDGAGAVRFNTCKYNLTFASVPFSSFSDCKCAEQVPARDCARNPVAWTRARFGCT